MGPQEHLVIDVEGILHIPGWVIQGQIQKGEIIVIQFDLRAVKHFKPHANQRIPNSPICLGHGVQASQRLGHDARLRYVQGFPLKLQLLRLAAEGFFLFFHGGCQLRLGFIHLGTHTGALFLGDLPHSAQNGRQFSAFAKELLLQVAEFLLFLQAAELFQSRCLDLFQSLVHACPPYI